MHAVHLLVKVVEDLITGNPHLSGRFHEEIRVAHEAVTEENLLACHL
jgi:hypothetical protein